MHLSREGNKDMLWILGTQMQDIESHEAQNIKGKILNELRKYKYVASYFKNIFY